jgi:hypothetical protein
MGPALLPHGQAGRPKAGDYIGSQRQFLGLLETKEFDLIAKIMGA